MQSTVVPPFISRQVVEARRFYLDMKPSPRARLAVVCGGWEQCAADYRVRRETFPYYSLECVVGGRGRVRLGARWQALERGVVFAYGPGVAHEIETEAERPLSKYFVDFTGTGAVKILAAGGLAAGQARVVSAAEGLQEAFERLIAAGQRTTAVSAQLAALQLEALPLLVADAWVPDEARARQAYQTYARCRGYIEAHYAELATVEDAAAACHVAPSYLSRVFRRFGGGAPYQFLLRLKMNQAARLLEDGQRLTREVADVFGMDPFHFSRVFRRVHGLSPSGFMRARVGRIREE